MLSRKTARAGAYIVLGTFVGSLILIVAGVVAQYLGAYDFARVALGVGVFSISGIIVWLTLPRRSPCEGCSTGLMSSPRIHEDADGNVFETSHCRACGRVKKKHLNRVR